MKTFLRFTMIALLMGFAQVLFAQDSRNLQFFRPVGQDGLNVFETSKADTVDFEGLKVRVGGDFSLLFQGLSQSNDLVGDTLVELSNNFTLPTANLNFDVQLYDGLRMHLRTYLSSRHHAEAWVKGGYIQMDKLDFISEGFLSGVMNVASIRVGMDEYNYGDTHFRRSDNARSIYNPFVGNYIMDAFSTEPFAEVTVQTQGGLVAVAGLTNGRLNQSPTPGDDGFAFYGKLGYDNQLNDDLRIRLTGSIYSSSSESTRDYLYNGDRAGARYYKVLNGISEARQSDFEPRWNTGFAYQTSAMINPFLKFKGFEFFGVFEINNNGDSDIGGGYNHTGAEAIYRFGANERFYVGGRYNTVAGEAFDGGESISISRTNIGGGFFFTKNILTKVEYVTSTYDGNGFTGSKLQGAEFNGLMIEAAVSF